MRLNRSLAAAAIVATLISSAACSNESDGEGAGGGSSDVLKIDALMGISGDIAAIGDAMNKAQKAAVAVINADGGVFGKPIELNTVDDGGNAPQAVAAAQKLISSGKPGVVVPGTISVEISATVPVFTKANWFVSEHGIDPSMNDPKKYPYVFGNAFLTKDAAEAMAVEFEKKGYKKIGIVTSDDVGGRSISGSEKTAMEAKGMTVEIGYVPGNAVDATPQMQQVLATNPDVLLLDAYGAPATPIIKARAKLMPNLPTYGGQNLTANNLAKLSPPEAYKDMTFESIAVAVKDTPVTKTESFKTFIEAVLKETGGKLDFTMNTYVVAYNDIILAATAAKLANSTDPAKMAAAIESATPEQIPLYVGPVNFSPTNHYPNYDSEWWVFVPYGPIENGLLAPDFS